jgi:hypothetical protein
MSNTSLKKLALHRETLRTLEANDLGGVNGGTGGITGAVTGAITGVLNDTVFRPGKQKPAPAPSGTVYRGGGKVIPV